MADATIKVEEEPKVQKWKWKELLAIVFIAVAIYFFYSQRKELSSLGTSLENTNLLWLLVGVFFTIVYILLQAGLYVYSFLSIGGSITWMDAIELFFEAKCNCCVFAWWWINCFGLPALWY